MDDVYKPTQPSVDARRRWAADKINPRHPLWKLQRQPLGNIEQWTLTAFHRPTDSDREIRIKEIRWETKNLSNEGNNTSNTPEAEYSATAIAELIERHADPETPVRVQLLVRETPWERQGQSPSAEGIKELIDTIYDPEN